jgi:diacylglycerol kinase (ATP)
MSDREALVIINPTAGAAGQLGLVEALTSQLKRQGIAPAIHLTTGPGNARELAGRAIADGSDFVVVAGGDGTVGEVTGPLTGTPARLGIIPLGTGNAIARELSLPLDDIPAACKIVAADEVRAIDVGVCNGHEFIIMCGVGLDAVVAERVHAGRWKGRLGKWAFVGQFLATALREHKGLFRVTVDGEQVEGEMWCAIICNGSQYTWRLSFAPEARVDDGLLHVVLFSQPDRLRLLRTAAHYWLADEAVDVPYVRKLSGRSIRVDVDPPARWQADGDAQGMSPVDVSLRPASLRVIVPPPR